MNSNNSEPCIEDQYSAWNPGIETIIPQAYEALETIYHSDNAYTYLSDVNELAFETGLNHEELVHFKPARLVLHELIVRITANIVVPEGEQEEDLGIHFREIASKILTKYIQPELAEIESNYRDLHTRLAALVTTELENSLFATVSKAGKKGWLSGLNPFKPAKKAGAAGETRSEKEFRVIASFRELGLNCDDPEKASVYRSLYRVLGSIANTRGYLGHDRLLLATITTRHVCNYHGSRLIGDKVEEIVDKAIGAENYPRIPDAEKPVLISLKGSSAAGKSSLRPMLQNMTRQLGIESYGTISPDIWRRLLLDYDSLGEAYKYAGRLTSYEVNVIDSKLDHYIREKAETRHSIPHMMVDRFRFDSFSSEKISRILHKTYVHYIDTMYMYFVITPPEETVSRGWERGLARGRYKSVEDYLGHCVEAYTGIPKLLFKWLSSPKPRYIFEFLDNSVPKGVYPTTIARGTQSSMEVLDPLAFVNIQRYQHINVMAETPRTVYPQDETLSVENNVEFLSQCIAKIEKVEFIEPESDQVYLRSKNRRFEIIDKALFQSVIVNSELAEVFNRLAPEIEVDNQTLFAASQK